MFLLFMLKEICFFIELINIIIQYIELLFNILSLSLILINK
jgi:hypothetical protein